MKFAASDYMFKKISNVYIDNICGIELVNIIIQNQYVYQYYFKRNTSFGMFKCS